MSALASAAVGERASQTLCDLGRAIAGLDQDVPALRAQCGSDCFGESVNAGQESGAALDAKLQLLFRLLSAS